MNITQIISYLFNRNRLLIYALLTPILFGCVSAPDVQFPKGQAITNTKEIYIQSPNDKDGFQLTLIKELSSHNITAIDSSYGGESRIISLSDKEIASYNKSPTRLSISYTYEPLYGWGAPITMSFQGKVVDLTNGSIVLIYSTDRGETGQRIKETAVEFANEVAKLFEK